MLEALFEWPNDWALASWWNLIPMMFGLVCSMQKIGIERIACGESKWILKGNMINVGSKEVRHQERRSTWCGVQGGQGECWWWWRSAEWNWGAQIQAKQRWQGLRSAYPAEHPIHAEQPIHPELCQKGREVKSVEWNSGTPNRGWGGDWGALILEEERWL